MTTKHHQLSLNKIFTDCQDSYIDDAPTFFTLLDEHLNLHEFIPNSFHSAFYLNISWKRDYPLSGFLSAHILQKIFSIHSDSLLIILLSLCKELREFCGFHKVPDAPLFKRFKQDFLPLLELMFQKLVDYTESICKAIDSNLADVLTFDTSGIELYVKENNPKHLTFL